MQTGLTTSHTSRSVYDALGSKVREHISTKESSYASTWLFRRDGTIPPHRLDTVLPRSGGGGLWWSDARRSLSSLARSARSERVRVVMDRRAGHGDAAPDLWPARQLS